MSARLVTTVRSLVLWRWAALGVMATAAAWAGEITYAVGSWPESGNGNHRAVVHVAAPADAVWAHIEWRRRDRNPETKDVRVVDLATGQRITNVVRAAMTREAGDIIFQPATAPGDYAVYYLPYTAPRGNFDSPGEYYPPTDTADPQWLARNGLDPEGLRSGLWRGLPEAELLRIEARSDFDRMDPMEVIATEAEVKQLLSRYPEHAYLVFPEDRTRPIRMLDEIPLCWVRQGPADAFTGEAQPGEYYCFQFGVWAARQDLGKLALHTTDLRTATGATIARDHITCFNLEGTDWLARPITKDVTVPQGRVQPLWIGIQVPRNAGGEYTGTVTVQPAGAPAWPVKLTLRVAGPVLEDGGVSDLWRMSRLKWLNSTLGIDEEVVPPFTPLQVRGNAIRCLLREVRFGPLGLPESIVSSKRQVLAAPVRLSVLTGRRPVRFEAEPTETTKITPGVVERITRAHAPEADLTVHCKMEADGCLLYRLTLEPRRMLRLSDIALEIPQRRDCAVYMMGLGKRGGLRPAEWRWKWDPRRANNMVWLGDVGAGMQLQLRGEQDVWEPVALTQAGFSTSWDNNGQGGCDVTEDGGQVLVRAYTGGRVLRPGRPLELRFRLIITPLRPIDPRHWQWRYGDTTADGTVLHVHHGVPENPYINYPFLKVPELTSLVREVQSRRTRKVEPGKLEYPAAGNFRADQGAVHIWTVVDFDPSAGSAMDPRYNQPLFHVEWPDRAWVGFYWCIDDRGMRAYVSTTSAAGHQFPILIPSHSPEWKPGEKHLVTLSWGEEFALFVDGVKKNSARYRGTLDLPLDDARLGLDAGGFIVQAIKICARPYEGGGLPTPVVDEDTLLLDVFFDWDGERTTRPQRSAGDIGGTITGTARVAGQTPERGLHLTFREVPALPKGVNVYYNVGQMSNFAAELWAIRSLGDEIMPIHDTNPTVVGETTFGKEGGGYPWLREHLVNGYIPGWRQPLPWLEQTDAAIEMQPLSRWHNYYVEGLNWLMRTTGVDGLYLDGIAYDREIMKRVAKVMARANPGYRINCHGGDVWSAPWDPDRRVSTANAYLEHFPYLSNLWFGELYDYNMPPDYWLVEISGIPFGLTSEMLNYQNGGNPYRGMLYGMTGRLHPSCTAMWRFWDEFGIQDAEWLGYWDGRCPVKTDNPSVLATVYRKPGKSLIALAHWPEPRARPGATATAQEATVPPTIDGRLAPGEWDQAARLTNFTLHEADDPAPDQTLVYVTWDRERLYLGFRCDQPGGNPKADALTRDATVWEDDSLEVFVQPDLKAPRYYHFIGNSAGVIYDAQGLGAPGWNGAWSYHASVATDHWEGELSIPLSQLEIRPGDGDTTIGLNLCRNQRRPEARASCWAPVSGTFHNPELFGTLTLSTLTASTRQEPVGTTKASTVEVRLNINWQALGLNPRRATLTAPSIANFQPAAKFSPGQPIPVTPNKGWLLIVHE